MDRGKIQFTYNKEPFPIEIVSAMCLPQAYAAAITMFHSLDSISKVLMVDIGGFTADYGVTPAKYKRSLWK